MVMPVDSSTNDHSPRSPVTAAAATTTVSGGVNSPNQSLRRSLHSPWASVVRGDSDTISPPMAASSAATVPRSPSSSPRNPDAPEQASASEKTPIENSVPETQPDSSDNNDGNVGRPKRAAWNKPVNGVIEPVSVMGGTVSWPALSESTRANPKSSSDSSKSIADGSANSSQGPIISQPPQRHGNANAHANSTGSHTVPSRQRPMKHRSGGGGGAHSPRSSQSGFSRPGPPTPPPVPPPFPMFDMPYRTMVPHMVDTSVRGMRPGVVGSHSHAGNDHSPHRNNSRRGNFGSRPRGDGTYHNSHGGRRDQDRRDLHLPHQFVPPPVGFVPSPPPGAGPFMPSPHVRAFPGPMGFDMQHPLIYVPHLHPEAYGAIPLVPPPQMVFPVVDPDLPASIVTQIEYYFSDGNLVRDDYLKSNMDNEGWVPVSLIAGFPRVKRLTTNVQLVLDYLKASTILEVQGDKVRRRNGWNKWLNISGPVVPDSSSNPSGPSTQNSIATSLENFSLNDTGADVSRATETTNVEMNVSPVEDGQSNLANGDGTAEEVYSTDK